MISHTGEGERLRPGLNWHINLRWKRFWFRLIWCRYDYLRIDAWYFIFRPYLYPWVILRRWKDQDLVRGWLFEHNLCLVTQETMADYRVPKDRLVRDLRDRCNVVWHTDYNTYDTN